MIGILERLLSLSGVPVVLGLPGLGAVVAVAGAWLRATWRGRHDVFLRQWPAHRALARRYRRDTSTARAITQRLHHEVGLDFRRWLQLSLGWWGLVVVTGWLGLALLERAWVRDQLERTFESAPVMLALLVFAAWAALLVATFRGALDRRSVHGGEFQPQHGIWPALSRAVPVIFVVLGAAAWLTNQVGYAVQVALPAVLLPITGLVVVSFVQDRLLPVRAYRTPLWVLQLMPELATPALGELDVVEVRPAGPHGGDGSGSLTADRAPVVIGPAVADAWQAVRRRVGFSLRSLTSALAGGPTGRGTHDGDTVPDHLAALRWSDLRTEPEPLSARDPRQLGSYRLHDRLGTGGMAVVFRATHRSGQEVAVKIPSQLAAVEAQVQQRLAAEMAALSRIDVPGVVRIREASSDDGLMFIAMDYLRGPTLDEAVTRLGPFEDRDLVRALAHRTARALAGLHAVGITHRDLKPRNLILTDSGPVLVDLGIAKVADATTHLTATGTLIGSAGYLPPEAHRNAPVGHSADVWAWGCCLALAVSGRPLFAGDSVHAILSAVMNHQPDVEALAALRRVDPELSRVVAAAVDPDPYRRPVDGAALVRVLPPSGAWTSPPRARSRH